MNEVVVKKPGFKATLFGGVTAVITGVLVKANGSFIYEASWWNGNENKTGWFQECEIESGFDGTMKIGFR